MADDPPPAAAPPPRRRGARANLRQRAASSDDDDGGPTVVKKVRGGGGGPLAFSTRGAGTASTSGAAGPSAIAHRYTSDRALQSGRDDLATAELQTETAFDRDARAVKEAALATAAAGPAADDGTYRGARGYVDHTAGFKRELTVQSNKATATGPLRASTTMRVSIRVDYAPDICKDYKDTGYCGYGDACKFMHDRGEHKAGWQLDREWDEKEKREAEAKRKAEAWAAGKGDGDDDRATAEDDDDGLPFACLLCKRAWTREAAPVVTRCGHYFCEACALSHHAAGGGRCASCQATTGGTFNVANAILKKLARVERERKG